MNRKLFASLVLFRFINLFFVKSWFVPDEFWQSQEVAHNLAFKYGYLTWEWKVGIRSYIYPVLISGFYKALALVGLDNATLIVYISPVLHSFLSAVGDYLYFVYVKNTFHGNLANKALFCRLISWYLFYTSPRSLTNSIEEFFTIWILYLQQKTIRTSVSRMNYGLFNLVSFVSFAFRPTAAINLIPIYIYQFFWICNSMKAKIYFFIQFLVSGLLVLSANTLIDSHYHGKFILTSYNFLLHNLVNNVGIHYGTHPWHWYLSHGLPTLLFSSTLFFIVGGLSHLKRNAYCLLAIAFNVLVYSLLSHKEFRFLAQTLPFVFIVCAYGIDVLERRINQKSYNFILVAIILTNFGLGVFLGLCHQRAPISVMDELRNDVNLSGRDSILFLTPCHSTPYYSHLHKNIPMRFLTCEPNLKAQGKPSSSYKDEADLFYENPVDWFTKNQKSIRSVTRIVIFKNLYDFLKRANLRSAGQDSHYLDRFYVCKEFFNAYMQITSRVDKTLLLLCSKNA